MLNHSQTPTEQQVAATLETIDRAIDQLVIEMSKCGGLGGTGRIQSFAPVLFFLRQSEEIIQDRYEIVADEPAVPEEHQKLALKEPILVTDAVQTALGQALGNPIVRVKKGGR